MRAKKYLFQIYLVITVAAILLVTTVMWSIYYAIKNNISELEHKMSIEMLTQIKNNIEFVEETSRNLCFSIFYDNNVQSLLHTKDDYDYLCMQSINRISDSYTASTPSIVSIYLYNDMRKEYYSTYNGIYNIDEGFARLIKEKRLPNNLSPIVRTIGDKTVVTYCLRESYDGYTGSDSAIFVNMDFNWFMNYMDTINRIRDAKNGVLFVFDRDNVCINTSIGKDAQLEEIQKLLSQKIQDMPKEEDALVFNLNTSQNAYTGTMLRVDGCDWKIARLYPYNQLFSGMGQIRVVIILVNLITVIVIMLLFMLVARGIYRPVDRLMQKLNITDKEGGIQDEFGRLEQYYLGSKEELRQLENEKETKFSIMRKYMLRKLLVESDVFTKKELDELKEQYGVLIDFNAPIKMLIVMIDDFDCLDSQYDIKADKALVFFGIINILSELFSEQYRNECVHIDDQYIVILYNTNLSESDESPVEIVRKAEKIVGQLFHLTFSIAVGNSIKSADRISACYNQLTEAFGNRFMLGKGCTIEGNRQTSELFTDYTFDEEASFLKYLSNLQTETAQKALSKLIDEIKLLDYQGASVAATHLTNSIRQVIFEFNRYRKTPIDAEQFLVKWDQVPMITLDEYQKAVEDFLLSLESDSAQGNNSRHQILAEAIRDYIDKMYDEYELSAAYVADILKISPAHAGRVFKEYTNMTIPEYINYVRLKKAMEWMKSSDLTIVEIMAKVGYQNESYFYKVFKDKFGMTPRAYVKSIHKKFH